MVTTPDDNVHRNNTLHSVLFEYHIRSWQNNQIRAFSKSKLQTFSSQLILITGKLKDLMKKQGLMLPTMGP